MYTENGISVVHIAITMEQLAIQITIRTVVVSQGTFFTSEL